MNRSVSFHLESWPLRSPFRITGKVWEAINLLVVHISQNGKTGQGEASGIFYLNENIDSMFRQARAVEAEIEAGISREELRHLLPPGGARNAIDCALWDLECKIENRSIWDKLDLKQAPLTTVITIGIKDTLEETASLARQYSDYPVLKVKLNDDRPVERLEVIRQTRPDATLAVDANQGFSFPLLKETLPHFKRLGLFMLEQPLPRGEDEALDGFESPVPLCADESCLSLDELEQAARRYDMINIKLDKSGGLTEALMLANAAKARGMPIMVGNMFGTSLAMAPAYVIGQYCQFVDLDGPLLQHYDRAIPMEYDKSQVSWPRLPLWGSEQ